MLDDLPATARQIVAEHLGSADVTACRLVSRGWLAAISAEVRELHVSADAAEEGVRLDRVAPFLHTLHVAVPSPSCMLLPEMVAALSPPRTLRVLHVATSDHGSSWVQVCVHGACFPGLREITVRCSTLFFDAQAASLLTSIDVIVCCGPVAACANLEALHITDFASPLQTVGHLPKLVTLDIDYRAMPLQRPTMGDVVDALPVDLLRRLQSFRLSGFKAGGRGLHALAACQHLTRLHICNEGWSRGPYVYTLPPHLEDLCLHDADALVLKGQASLRSLSLVNDGAPVPAPLAVIAEARNLCHLSLQGYFWPRDLGPDLAMPCLLSVLTFIPLPSPTGSFGALTILGRLAEACPTLERLTVFSLEVDAMCCSLGVTALQTRCLPGWTGVLEQRPTPPWSLSRTALTLTRD